MPYGSKLHTYQLSFPSYSTRAIQKSLTLKENNLRVFWREKSQDNGPLAEKWQDKNDFLRWSHNCSIFISITMVKLRLFCWWCYVCCIVLLTLCIIILRVRHDHNKIAPCGMIKVFWIELNWIEDRNSKRTRQKKNRRGDRKGESSDSPEIPDRNETSDIPGLPSGSVNCERNKV